MQGYATLADEAVEQMQAMGIKQPTHVLLQAGVGALAGGVLGYLVDCFGAKNLHSIVVEPDQADCIYRSGVAGRWSTWGRHAHHHGRPRLRRTQSPRLAGAARLHHPVHLLSRQGLGARHARARQPLGDDPASSPANPARSAPACWRRCVTTRIARR